jgi:hypothetical protein
MELVVDEQKLGAAILAEFALGNSLGSRLGLPSARVQDAQDSAKGLGLWKSAHSWLEERLGGNSMHRCTALPRETRSLTDGYSNDVVVSAGE